MDPFSRCLVGARARLKEVKKEERREGKEKEGATRLCNEAYDDDLLGRVSLEVLSPS